MRQGPGPPRLAEWLLEHLAGDGVVGESIVGDSREAYIKAVVDEGRLRASLTYCWDVVRIGLALRSGRAVAVAGKRRAGVLSVGDDVRQMIRSLIRSPGFAAVTVVTLGIGFGATAAVFSVVDGVLLRPLPYEDPESLVTVMHSAPGIGAEGLGLSTGTFFTFLDESRTLDGIAAWGNDLVGVTDGGDPEEVEAVALTSGMFALLGVRPALGRLFTGTDDTRGTPLVVILSDEYWRTRLGADPAAVGGTLTIEGVSVEIVGVLQAGFRFMEIRPLLFFPIRFDRSRAFVGSYNYMGVARLSAGATPEAVEAELTDLIPRAAETYAGGATVERVGEMQLRPVIRPLKEAVTGDVGSMLWLLLGATAFVLIVGCANVANLFLVRAEARHRELSIRSALGAPRGRMARLFLLESGTLAVMSGALGVGLAAVGIWLVRALGPADVPRLGDVRINLAVLAFAASVAAVAMLILGLVPFLSYGRMERAGWLADAGRGQSPGLRRHRARSALAVTQLALALTLLIGAGLMMRSLRATRSVHPGFTAPAEILTFRVAIPVREAADPSLVVATHRRILESIQTIPGVASVGLSSSVPMDGRTSGNTTTVEERSDETAPSRRYKFVSRGFFATMGTPLLAGRDFTWSDIESRRDVAIVSERFAREYWPDPETAIGKRIAQNPAAGWRSIVGVVADIRDDGPTGEPRALVYWPMAVRDFWGNPDLVQRSLVYAVRSVGRDPLNLAGAVRRAVWSINDRLPVAAVRTQQSIVDARTARSSFVMVLLGIASGIALLLGVVGLYGVISYLVSTRSREIGIRLAIGAAPGRVIAMVLRQGAGLALIGVAAGSVVAALMTRLLSGLLFGVAATDPATYVAAAVVVVVVALLAAGVPALRAASIDPIRALEAD